MGPLSPPTNWEVALRDDGGSMDRVEDMLQNIMRRFDTSDDHVIRRDIANILQKVEEGISIEHLELQMSQLSNIVNPCQPCIFLATPSKIEKMMNIGFNQTIDPPLLYVVEDDRRKDKEVLEVSGELVDDTVIEVEVSQKVVSIPRPPPSFP